MSAAPSQRRGLPQPAAVSRSVNDSAVASAGASENTANPAGSQGSHAARTTTYVFTKSAAAPSLHLTTATATTKTSADPRHGNESYVARPAAATFPWFSRPVVQQQTQPQTSRMIMRPTHNDDSCGRGNNSNYHSAAAAGDETAFVDLAATPEKQRRTRLASAMHEQNSHLDTPTSSSPQYVDPSTDNGANSRAGSSSLVFALSEDSELKVLASRVGPHVTVAPTNRAAPPTVLHRGGNHGASHTANQCRPAPSDLLLTSSNVTSAALADEVNGSGAYRPAPALRQLRPHTPSTHRDARDGGGGLEGIHDAAKPSVRVPPQQLQQRHPSSSVGTNSGSTSAPPQQQQQQPTVTAARAPFPSSTGVALYRTSPHELPSPPALHVCPGGVPGTGVAPAPAGNTNSCGGGGGGANTRWASNGIPSVALYPSVPAPAAPAAAKVAPHTRGNNRSGIPSAAPEGCGAAKSHHQHHTTTLSNDARSLHSKTPPPSTLTSQPIDKDFTPAQFEAVLQEVQQELYLNYTAVPIPADMINRGDTDERRRRLEQRQKQIAYGKETEGYAKYTCLVPRPCDREYHNPLHALTPRPEYDCSKRQFDRVLNAWRRQLHQWDDCDLDNLDEKFLSSGKATLMDFGLAAAPASTTHTPTTDDKPPQQPTGVMHSIANVAAMAHDHDGARDGGVEGGQRDDEEDGGGASHTRSPVFTGNTPTSALYSSGLSMHLNSGRASAMTAAACTPSRPQMSEGAEGPQVDDSFFLHMNSGNSRIASPYHPTYSGTGHVANSSYYYNYNSGGGGAGGGGAGAGNGRSSTNAYYQQFMRSNSYAHHNGGTPGSNYAMHIGLTPAHRPPSRNSVPHHITAIFNSEYELMAPSGPGSPSGMPHNPRSGGSPYRLGEPWMPNRRSPTYAMSSAAQCAGHRGTGSPANHNHSNTTPTASTSTTAAPPNIITANSAGTIVMTGTRGESPPQTTELALIPSTSQSSSGGFAQSPYGFRVHSPVQPQQQQPQTSQPVAYATPLTRPQSRPGLTAIQSQLSTSPSRSPIGLPPQQRERVAIAITMAAAARSRRGSGLVAAPTTWTPPNPQAQVRPSPHTPQLHLAVTPLSTKRPEAQD